MPETSSAAFASVSREGALHVNHDRGAASVGPDGVLFAMLDVHTATMGAAVSTYCQRNLFSAFAAAAAAGLRNVEAMGTAFAQTAAGLARSGIDARFSGTTAILAKLDRAPDGGRVVTVGFVGDSRAVLGRSRVGARKEAPLMTVPLTKDHSARRPEGAAAAAGVQGDRAAEPRPARRRRASSSRSAARACGTRRRCTASR